MDSVGSLYDGLRRACLDLAWRQWTAIGVAGVQRGGAAPVDPEALLLATLSVGRHDARLFDEALDWVSANAGLLDLARLRRLSRGCGLGERRVLTAMARLVEEKGGNSDFGRVVEQAPSREALAETVAADGHGALEPLFFSQATGHESWGTPDPLFASVGLLRSTVQLRGLSGRPDPGEPACLRFGLRALVGTGSRAEVLVYLLTHEWAHGRLIAERTAYGQAPVAAYLTALLQMRLVERREEGRKVLYRLDDRLRGAFPQASPYVDWVRVWPALVALLESLRVSSSSGDVPVAGAPAELSVEAAWVGLAMTLTAEEQALRAEGFGVAVGDLRGWAKQGPAVLAAVVDKVTAQAKQLLA